MPFEPIEPPSSRSVKYPVSYVIACVKDADGNVKSKTFRLVISEESANKSRFHNLDGVSMLKGNGKEEGLLALVANDHSHFKLSKQGKSSLKITCPYRGVIEEMFPFVEKVTELEIHEQIHERLVIFLPDEKPEADQEQ